MKDSLTDRPDLTADLERRLIATGMAPCQPPNRDLHAARGVGLGLVLATVGWLIAAGMLALYGVCW